MTRPKGPLGIDPLTFSITLFVLLLVFVLYLLLPRALRKQYFGAYPRRHAWSARSRVRRSRGYGDVSLWMYLGVIEYFLFFRLLIGISSFFPMDDNTWRLHCGNVFCRHWKHFWNTWISRVASSHARCRSWSESFGSWIHRGRKHCVLEHDGPSWI